MVTIAETGNAKKCTFAHIEDSRPNSPLGNFILETLLANDSAVESYFAYTNSHNGKITLEVYARSK